MRVLCCNTEPVPRDSYDQDDGFQLHRVTDMVCPKCGKLAYRKQDALEAKSEAVHDFRS